MARSRTRMEINALRSDLRQPASRPDTHDAAGAGKSPESGDQVERVIQDLQNYLTEASGRAEDLVAEHPLIALTSAFLLGVAVGRLSR